MKTVENILAEILGAFTLSYPDGYCLTGKSVDLMREAIAAALASRDEVSDEEINEVAEDFAGRLSTVSPRTSFYAGACWAIDRLKRGEERK